MAISRDPDARPGSFWKYAGPNFGFTHPGLGGVGFAVGAGQNPDGSLRWGTQRGLSLRAGANPGIHFNVFLNKWVMIWQHWEDNNMYISTNTDVSNPDGWETPRFLLGSIDAPGEGLRRAWHPTVVCEGGGSSWCPGNTGRLYYSDRWRAGSDRRDFVSRTITFSRSD
jgi:hypothetical protein